MGNVLLVILIIAAALGAVAYLIRGIVVFLKTTEEDLKSDGTGPSQSSLRQNKMMMGRIMMQALAILAVALLLLFNSGK
jgi:hypothetical protein